MWVYYYDWCFSVYDCLFQSILNNIGAFLTSVTPFFLSLGVAFSAIRYREYRQIILSTGEFRFYLMTHAKQTSQQVDFATTYLDNLLKMDRFITPKIELTIFPDSLLSSITQNQFLEYYRRNKPEDSESAMNAVIKVNLSIKMLERYEKQCVDFNNNLEKVCDEWNANIKAIHTAIQLTHKDIQMPFTGIVEDEVLKYILSAYAQWVKSEESNNQNVIDLFVSPVDETLQNRIQANPSNKYCQLFLPLVQAQKIIYTKYLALISYHSDYVKRYIDQLKAQESYLSSFCEIPEKASGQDLK